jgi:hypothetical protein
MSAPLSLRKQRFKPMFLGFFVYPRAKGLARPEGLEGHQGPSRSRQAYLTCLPDAELCSAAPSVPLVLYVPVVPQGGIEHPVPGDYAGCCSEFRPAATGRSLVSRRKRGNGFSNPLNHGLDPPSPIYGVARSPCPFLLLALSSLLTLIDTSLKFPDNLSRMALR